MADEKHTIESVAAKIARALLKVKPSEKKPRKRRGARSANRPAPGTR
jgi:hypothetical protein